MIILLRKREGGIHSSHEWLMRCSLMGNDFMSVREKAVMAVSNGGAMTLRQLES